MEFKSLVWSFGVLTVAGLAIYLRNMIFKNDRLRSIIANLKNSQAFDEEKKEIEKEVQNEDLNDLVNDANDRLRKRREE